MALRFNLHSLPLRLTRVSAKKGSSTLVPDPVTHSFYGLRRRLKPILVFPNRCAAMAEKGQALNGELLDKRMLDDRADEWRPQRYGSPNSPPTVTVSVTKGRSIGKTHRLTKPRASIGYVDGVADMQIDDPEAARLHCAVAITDNGIRLYDLDSASGTFIDDVRIQIADLEHLAAFRVGSTEFVVCIVAAPV
jgi:type III secretion system (T3SS) inner membrane Yop/YscD-like protein